MVALTMIHYSNDDDDVNNGNNDWRWQWDDVWKGILIWWCQMKMKMSDEDDEHSQWTYSDYEHKENHLQKELKNTIQQPVADPTRSSSATSYINSPIS